MFAKNAIRGFGAWWLKIYPCIKIERCVNCCALSQRWECDCASD